MVYSYNSAIIFFTSSLVASPKTLERTRATPSTNPPPRATPSPPRRTYNVEDVGKNRKDSLGILNLIGNATKLEVKKLL